MRWPIFQRNGGSPMPKRRPTVAELLREPAKLVKLPRQVHHALERERRISLDESRMAESDAIKEVRTMSEQGPANLEALVAGSSQEMKQLHTQLSATRLILKKLEMSYLFHYHRQRLARRALAKVTKVAPGVSGRRESVKRTIQKNLDGLSSEERKIAEKLLGKF